MERRKRILSEMSGFVLVRLLAVFIVFLFPDKLCHLTALKSSHFVMANYTPHFDLSTRHDLLSALLI
ncbi:hypothetical protein ES708_14213 [subsurface metagenome]